MLLTMESKTAAHHKLETLIAKGRETAGTVIDHVMNNQPTDRLARASALHFQADPELRQSPLSTLMALQLPRD